MKRLTRWTSKISKFLAAALCFAAFEANAGLISILKHGRPEAPEAAPAPARPEWQRVAFVGSAVIKEVSGRVEMLKGVDRWVAIGKGQRLQPGDLVRTGEGSRAVLKMESSGSFVAMTPKTILRLSVFEKTWDQSVLSGVETRKGYKVRSLRGVAEVKKNNQWLPLSVESVIPVGASVRTHPNTTMDLFHSESGSFIRLQPSVEVALDPAVRVPARLVVAQTGPLLKGTKTAQVSQ
jgi:hypothetical protein